MVVPLVESNASVITGRYDSSQAIKKTLQLEQMNTFHENPSEFSYCNFRAKFFQNLA